MSRLFVELPGSDADVNDAETYRFPTSKEAVRAFYTPTPTHLAVADKPPRLGGAIKQVPLAEFCESQNIVWADAPVVSDDYLIRLWREGDMPNTSDYIEHRIFNPLSIVLANMGQEMGLGAFLSESEKTIKAGDIVHASYGGLLLDDPLAMTQKFKNPYLFNLETEGCSLVAEKYRGVAGYFQHAPAGIELKQASNMDSEINGKIFHANLIQHSFTYLGIPILAFFAMRDIEPGDPLVYPYGPDYWKDRTCYVINAEGLPIGTMNDRGFFALSDLSESALQTDVKTPTFEGLKLGTNADESIDYAVSFMKNLAFYLQDQMMLSDCSSPRFQYAAILYEALTSSASVNDAWSKIDVVFKKVQPSLTADRTMYDFANRVYSEKEACRNRKSAMGSKMGRVPVDLSDLPFALKPENRNYMIRFTQEVKKIISGLDLKTDALKQRKRDILADIAQCETSDDVFRYLSKCSPDWKQETSSFNPLMQPLIKLMRFYNAAQKVARNNQDYTKSLREEYKAQLMPILEDASAISVEMS